jgi:hypothetical protein
VDEKRESVGTNDKATLTDVVFSLVCANIIPDVY